MKVRKLAVALALAGGLGSGVAQALGLGEIELQSYLNEPLDADINLRKSEGVSPGDVFVNIAPQSAYERVGIDRSYFLTKLNFQVTTAPDGSLVVNVSSREPLREPYLNFLVEVTWPNGRLMREYAVLVDPPVYAEESGVQEQVSAPAVSQSSQPQQQARQVAPTRTGSTNQGRSPGSRTLGPTNSADTLWTIASQIRPNNNVSMQQVMLAVQDLNPDAFIDDNINRLKRGEILRIPDEEQIRSRSRAQANQEVAAQNRALSAPQQTVDATGDIADSPAGEASGGSGGDQLRLVAADDTASRDAADGGSAGGDGETAGGVDAGTAVALEELEGARRENEELTGRVDDLQNQVETLQRLIELKNSQLAEMQSAQGESREDGTMVAGEASSPEASEAGDTAGSVAAEDGTGTTEQQEIVSEAPTSETMEEGASADSEPEMTAEAPAEAEESGAQQSPEETGDAMADSVAPAEQPEPATTTAEPEPAPTDTGPAQKPFPGNIIDAIANNFIYQVALGGGLVVLLLLLLLLARRNANREKEFYEQLNSEAEGDDTDSFDLTFDEEETAETPEDDAIAEADAYIAYGRNDQAAHTLETAISREPSRSDLRLKLLGVYADIQDRESFDKQFREIEALDDEAASAEARSLQSRLEEDESMPSIDDLESQLRSGGSDQQEKRSYDSEYDLQPYDEPESDNLEGTASERTDAEPDFEDMDLDLPDADDERQEAHDLGDDDSGEAAEEDGDDLIEFDLSGIESEDEPASESGDSDEPEESEEPFDLSLDESDLDESDLAESDQPDSLSEKPEADEEDDLSLDFEPSELEIDDEPESISDGDESEASPAPGETEGKTEDLETKDLESEDLEIDGDGELDESFLDELDAELDKVAGEDETPEEGGGSELDDLELDVSDEDLALMEEFSESDDVSPSEKPESAEDDELSLDDELGLEDALGEEEPADPEQEVEGAEQADEMVSEGGPTDSADEEEPGTGEVAPPIASDTTSGGDSDGDIDEADIGDDDDFDFLAGTDEAATKLDLARAYVEMGDVDGARDILEEVTLEGNDEQKAEAQDLLKNLS